MIELFALNKNIFLFIQYYFVWKNDYLDMFFIFIGHYLIYLMILFYILFFLKIILKDKKIELKEFIYYSSFALVAWGIARILKFLIEAERPFSYFNLKTLMTDTEVWNSFPSGHATIAFGLATAIYLYNKKIGYWVFFIAILVSLGRVLIGVHFPLDILVGSILGILTPVFLKRLFSKFIHS